MEENTVKRLIGILVLLIVAAFALPVMIKAIESLIPALMAAAVLLGVGTMIYQRHRRW
jgi:uncharacterized membrane protein YccC